MRANPIVVENVCTSIKAPLSSTNHNRVIDGRPNGNVARHPHVCSPCGEHLCTRVTGGVTGGVAGVAGVATVTRAMAAQLSTAVRCVIYVFKHDVRILFEQEPRLDAVRVVECVDPVLNGLKIALDLRGARKIANRVDPAEKE